MDDITIHAIQIEIDIALKHWEVLNRLKKQESWSIDTELILALQYVLDLIDENITKLKKEKENITDHSEDTQC